MVSDTICNRDGVRDGPIGRHPGEVEERGVVALLDGLLDLRDVVLGELQTIPDVLSTETIMVLDEQPILPRRY